MDVGEVEALLSEAGRTLADRFFPYDSATAMNLGQRARREAPADLVAAAMTQARLRTKAIERLGPDAERLWFTPDGLEQATRPDVARHRAQHLVASGATRVADVGCGLGFDSHAMARAGLTVLAIERDPATAALARANAAALDLSEVITVVTAEATDVDLVALGCDAVFIDPARREGGRRVKDPQKWSPPWSAALSIAATMPMAGLKVAPGIDHALPPEQATTEWISDHGHLVEACVWLGSAADPQLRRRATMLPSGESVTDAELPAEITVGALGRYLLEPDDAVIRSGLVGVVAHRVNGRLIDASIAYLTCDETVAASPMYAAFEVIESWPFSLKHLRKRVHALGIGRVEVKKRGSAIDPEVLRKQLKLDPHNAVDAVILLTRLRQDPFVVIAKRVS